MTAGWRRLGWLGMAVTLWGCVATSVHSAPEAATTEKEADRRPWLGVVMGRVGGPGGVPIKRVYRGSPAEVAGLQAGDRMKAIDGREVLQPGQVLDAVLLRRPREAIEVVYEREGAARKATVKLEVFPGGDEVLRRERVGAAAPELRGLVAVQGQAPLTIEGMRGKVVVLDFWASWCKVCRKTAPILNRWHEQLTKRGVVVLGVSSDPQAWAERGIASFDIRYPVAIDEDEHAFADYGAAALPTLFVIDKKGVVRAVEVGFSPASMQALERLLGELVDEG